MERTIKSKRCPHCQAALVKSDNPEYSWLCMECCEDFYDFEAKEYAVSFSEPTEQDGQAFAAVGFHIDLSSRVKVEARAEGGSPAPYGFCFMERERVERLGERYVAEHAKLVWMDSFDEYQLEVSQNDWYNDLSRNPERVISVRYFGQESGTWRELYRDGDGVYYAREVFYPRENCAKWYIYGRSNTGDGSCPRPNTIFRHNSQDEKVLFDDWNGTMAYSETFNKNFRGG